jgi:2-polyprenyl-6-methoxyphenol hydroxylase-like FAD-dependent oxidoreductase
MLRARARPVRRPRRRTDGDGETAVVIGAGISGLLAARVLADVFDRVLVLERDALPDGPEFRSDVPQGRHVHVLLARGQSICEELLPGLSAELKAAGAPLFDTGYAEVLFPHGPAAPSPCGISVLLASRPLLETHIRRRVAALNGVVIQDATRVTGLSFDDTGARVIGVRAAGRGPGHTWNDDAAVAAALVGDASGRASKLAAWLRAPVGRTRRRPSLIRGWVTRRASMTFRSGGAPTPRFQ